MSDTVKALIHWVPESEGGRRTLFTGSTYSTVARFEEDKANFPKQAWSLVLQFDEPASPALEKLASVRFLVEDAPFWLLHPGSRFELIEGYRVVAEGQVLDY